jgi:hypothetical protein
MDGVDFQLASTMLRVSVASHWRQNFSDCRWVMARVQ